MADKKLGKLGLEITLPPLTISLPVKVRKKVVRDEMSDGSIRPSFFKEHKEWDITYPVLTKAELDALILLRSYDQILRWQNNDESADWYDVIIVDFDYNTSTLLPTISYFASMSLEQIV